MRVPVVGGLIRRRIRVDFRVDPAVVRGVEEAHSSGSGDPGPSRTHSVEPDGTLVMRTPRHEWRASQDSYV